MLSTQGVRPKFSIEHGVRIMLWLSFSILDAIRMRGYVSLALYAVIKLSVTFSKHSVLIGFIAAR
jgi:hypothetical protein